MNTSIIRSSLFSLGVSLTLASAGAGQMAPVSKLRRPEIPATAAPTARSVDTSERAIAAEKNVNLSLCIDEADLKINGWNREEVRVFIKNGSSFLFKVQLRGTSGKPALLTVYAYSPRPGRPMNECLSGEEIEIDAPVGAAINIKGREARTAVDTVRKVSIQTIGGDILLRNIGESVSAVTGQGDITVEASKGPMMLSTTTGNIVAFDVGPQEIGDVFKAKTNSGSLSLQDLGYRQVEVNSISGSIVYAGPVINGATYGIGTSNGSIRLELPQKANFQLSAIFASGNFRAELPFRLIQEDIRDGSIKNIVARFGTGGDAVVKLTTNAGLIGIRGQ